MKKFLILAPDGVEFEVVRVTSDMQSILVMETPTSDAFGVHNETDNSSAYATYNNAESDLL